MFINNINPVLVKLGIIEIRYYGVIYALGFIISYFFLRHFLKKGMIKNMTEESLDDLMIYIIIGVVVGARLFYFVFYTPLQIFTDSFSIFRVWEGGLSFHGGLIGVMIAISIFCKKYKLRFYNILDALVIPAALGLALGRIGNFLNQELYGTLTNVPWCVKFLTADGCRHPYQIYASISHFIMFGILLYIYKKQIKEGTAFWSFVLLYGIFRFITDFWREEIRIFGLAEGQILCLLMIIVSLVFLIKENNNIRKR